jgi:hypothetical protein
MSLYPIVLNVLGNDDDRNYKFSNDIFLIKI